MFTYPFLFPHSLASRISENRIVSKCLILPNPVNSFLVPSFTKQIRGSTDGSGSDGAVCDRRRLAGRRLLCAATHSLPSRLSLLDVRAGGTPVQAHQALHGNTLHILAYLHHPSYLPVCLSVPSLVPVSSS